MLKNQSGLPDWPVIFELLSVGRGASIGGEDVSR